MPTKDQERARQAFAATEEVRKWSAREQGEYKSLVLGLPALIHDCGLCQSMAFLRAKNKKHHRRVIGDLCLTLLGKDEDQNYDRLAKTVRDAELPRYQHLSMEALRVSEYLKRYAEAFLDAGSAQPGSTAE
jgi:CRISPR type III-B/RAMP module-associated protein Cmr5